MDDVYVPNTLLPGGGIAGPALQATMAGHVPPNSQGELQGALTSLMSVTAIIGPLIMNNLFWFFSSNRAPIYFPGIPFLLGAIFMLTSVFIVWKVLSRDRKHAPQTGAFDKPVQQ